MIAESEQEAKKQDEVRQEEEEVVKVPEEEPDSEEASSDNFSDAEDDEEDEQVEKTKESVSVPEVGFVHTDLLQSKQKQDQNYEQVLKQNVNINKKDNQQMDKGK